MEDDAFMMELLAQELANAGFEVVGAKNGVEGVQKFKEAGPDLMLLDILLPDQNGFETLRQIRREPNGPEAKAVFLSNLADGSDIEEAKRLGALDYMVKANFTLPEIVAKIKGVLGI